MPYLLSLVDIPMYLAGVSSKSFFLDTSVIESDFINN